MVSSHLSCTYWSPIDTTPLQVSLSICDSSLFVECLLVNPPVIQFFLKFLDLFNELAKNEFWNSDKSGLWIPYLLIRFPAVLTDSSRGHLYLWETLSSALFMFYWFQLIRLIRWNSVVLKNSRVPFSVRLCRLSVFLFLAKTGHDLKLLPMNQNSTLNFIWLNC